MSVDRVSASSCGGHCCTCALNTDGAAAGAWHGWRLVLASVGTFLFPLTGALIGALLGGVRVHVQVAGCLAGLCVGALFARGLTALLSGFKAFQHDPARV